MFFRLHFAHHPLITQFASKRHWELVQLLAAWWCAAHFLLLEHLGFNILAPINFNENRGWMQLAPVNVLPHDFLHKLLQGSCRCRTCICSQAFGCGSGGPYFGRFWKYVLSYLVMMSCLVHGSSWDHGSAWSNLPRKIQWCRLVLKKTAPLSTTIAL